MRAPFYEQTFYGHAGDTFGTNTIVMYNPSDSISIALCINGCATSRNDILIGVSSAIYGREYDYPDFSALQQYVAPVESLPQYAGTYNSAVVDLPIIIEYNDDGNLSFYIKGQPSSWLESKSSGVFVNTPTGVGIAFRDKDRFAFRQHGNLIIYSSVK